MRLFGFEIKREHNQDKQNLSFVNKSEDDGSVNVASGGTMSTFVDLEGSARTEADLVNKYRSMTLNAEVASAVDDIVNEAIVINSWESPVECITDDIPFSDDIKKKIREEFNYGLELLDFSNQGYDIFSKWYIDGRVNYHVIIDSENPQKGIIELRYIDPRKIRKIKEYEDFKDENGNVLKKLKNEYYLYTNNSFVTASGSGNDIHGGGVHSVVGMRIAKDSIINSNSGIINDKNTVVLSYLHQAYKPLNQLRMLEDAMTIYRISRAPERRAFYVDVGGMNKPKAEQYIRDLMVKHKNKISYDSTTGEVRDDRNFLTITDDFWMPRMEGGRGTEIVPLNGGSALGETGDLDYMQKKLYKALRVPIARLESDSTFQLGRTSEISRDEIKFSKFINRLRVRFSMLFDNFLEIQLLLKGIVSEDDWAIIKNKLRYDFQVDNHFEELKNLDVLRERLSLVGDMENYIGSYFSREYIKKKVLFQSEDEIEEIKKQIEQEEASNKENDAEDSDQDQDVSDDENSENSNQINKDKTKENDDDFSF